MSKSAKFRAGVGAIIINGNGDVLAFERTGLKDAWQLPQGGLDQGEKPLEGVYREVFEETAIAQEELELIAEQPNWLAYAFPTHLAPGNNLGQVQKWFLFRYLGNETTIDLNKAEHDEFQAWRWMPMQELAASIVEFKKHVYVNLATFLKEHVKR